MGSGAGICSSDEISVLPRHSKRSPGNTSTPTHPPPPNLTLQFLNLVTAQKLITNTVYSLSKPSDRFGVNQECFSKISFVKAW